MITRGVRYLIIGLVFFVIGLVAFLPAHVVAGWIESQPGLELGGVTGTLFAGHAAYASGPGGTVENLDWTLNPATLLLGGLSADIRVDSDRRGFSAVVTRSLFGNTQIDNLSGSASTGWLAQRAGYRFMPLAGDVTVDISHIKVDGEQRVTALDGYISIGSARWQLANPPLMLGDVDTAIDHTENGIRARITDSEGPLAVEGQVTIAPTRRYDVDARVRARAGAEDRMSDLLGQLGQADDAGWHRIREQGRL